MIRSIATFVVAVIIFLIDQSIKEIFVNGASWYSKCVNLSVTYNDGIAFSMLSSLKEYLKYLQLLVFFIILFYLYFDKEMLKKHFFALGLILGSGLSNIYDRFEHNGVVDYVYWHCGFDFAIFNFADVMINLGVLLIILKTFFGKKDV